MAVLLNTSLGDLVIDLHTDQCPLASKNFLKLCKIKYYNNCLFHTVHKDFIVQTGDPSGTGSGGDSIYKHLYGDQARFFNDEFHPKLKHDKAGTVAMASAGENLNASQFYITTREGLDYLDGKHTVFGEVAEGLETLMRINEAYVDEKGRPFKNIRIKHTYVLDDPYDDPVQLTEFIPEKSPDLKIPDEGEDVRLEDDWIPMDEQLGKEELEQSLRRNEAHSRAVVLEMVGDIPEAEIKPPENVLFVCKLNPVTQEEDLEIIFSRFGKIISADIIRDYKTGDSLCYAFIEFETQEACEAAYFKMDNVLIDDRRIHVDFSQSVSKLWTRYRRFGNKDRKDGEGTDGGCLNCGEIGHFGKDCPNQTIMETQHNQEKPKYKLKNMEGQHGGSNKRYEMLFEETSDEASKYGKSKEKSSRKHYHEKGSSEEERADRINVLLQTKTRRGKTHGSEEQENSGYGSRRQNSAMDEKGKERAGEKKHVHAGSSDEERADRKTHRGKTHKSEERENSRYGSRRQNSAMDEKGKEKSGEENHVHAGSSEEERADRINVLMQTKTHRGKTHNRSEEQENSGYGSRRQNSAMDEKGKERAGEEKHVHAGSSEEERADRINVLLQTKTHRGKTHRSEVRENSRYGSRRQNSAMDEKWKERAGEEKHVHAGSSEEERADRNNVLLQIKTHRGKTHRSEEQENSGYGSRRQNSAMDEKGKDRAGEEKHVHAANPDGRYLLSHRKNTVDQDQRQNRNDYQRHHDRDGRYDVSGMKRSRREDGLEEKDLQRQRDQNSTYKDHHRHGEHRHNKSRNEKEQRSSPGSKDIKHDQAKYYKDAE